MAGWGGEYEKGESGKLAKCGAGGENCRKNGACVLSVTDKRRQNVALVNESES